MGGIFSSLTLFYPLFTEEFKFSSAERGLSSIYISPVPTDMQPWGADRFINLGTGLVFLTILHYQGDRSTFGMNKLY